MELSPAELDKLGLDLKDDAASGVDLKSAIYMRLSKIEPVMRTVDARAADQQIVTSQSETDAFDALVRSNDANREATKQSLAQQHALASDMLWNATNTVNGMAAALLATTQTLLADQRSGLQAAVVQSLGQVQDMAAALSKVDEMGREDRRAARCAREAGGAIQS